VIILTWISSPKRGGRFREKGLFQFKSEKALFLQCHIVAPSVKNILCFYGFCLRKKRKDLILTRKENEAVMFWGYYGKTYFPKP